MGDICLCCGAPLDVEGRWVCRACELDPLRLARKPVRLKDLLTEQPCHITYKYNISKDGTANVLCGHCDWTGWALISLDGDGYDLMDIITQYKQKDDQLTVWVKEEY